MRLVLLSVFLAATLAACANMPPPPNQEYGPPSFDRSTRTLYLNGEAYYVPPSVNTVRLEYATMITATWEQQGDRRVLTRYSVDEWSDAR